jgi:steroid 5-alpha reductase family enzyme
MEIWKLWMEGFAVVLVFMSLIWLWSVKLKNAGIVDPFWGLGFVVVAIWYAYRISLTEAHQWVLLAMVAIWGLRLFIYLFIRNYGKAEDYRYQQFRRNYGEKRYWWFSFFQVFMLQGVLLAFISISILGGMFPSQTSYPFWFILSMVLWLVGFVFEAGGDFQMARFKADPANAGKVMDKGFWRYTRHPNYFGDTMVWWAYAFMAVYNGYWWAIAGAILMTWLIVRISGVAMLEKNLKTRRQGYDEYIKRTSAFFPWFPSKSKKSV